MKRDLARERLKEIRTLQGFEAAYKAAGFTPKAGEKRNTQVKRLSRLINRKTGGYQKLDSKQRSRINRTYRSKTRQNKLIEARSDRFIKSENKVRAGARKEAHAFYGVDGIKPNAKRLKNRLQQYKNLTSKGKTGKDGVYIPSDKERWSTMFKEAEKGGAEGSKLRKNYAQQVSRVPVGLVPEEVRKEQKVRVDKAERAAWRESGSGLSFKKWRSLSPLQRYGA
jgi:hypothetical protein